MLSEQLTPNSLLLTRPHHMLLIHDGVKYVADDLGGAGDGGTGCGVNAINEQNTLIWRYSLTWTGPNIKGTGDFSLISHGIQN